MPAPAEVSERVTGAHGTELHVRVTRAPRSRATVLMLHGLVSHSGWLRPLAAQLAQAGVSVLCPDRRGAGENRPARGDAPDEDALLEDVARIAAACAEDGSELHLCGVCWGGIYAVRVLAEARLAVKSLLLLAPGIFPRLAAVPAAAADAPLVDAAIPLDAFTRGPAYRSFILPDPLRLEGITPRFHAVSTTMLRAAQRDLLRLRVPTLLVLAEEDRITDNVATRRVFTAMRAEPRRLAMVPGAHGLQFDAPEEVVGHVLAWIRDPGPEAPSGAETNR